jgi:hypothetical protein
MSSIRRNRPGATSEAAPKTTTTKQQVQNQSKPECRRCAYGTVCVCWYYQSWTFEWPDRRNEPVSVQSMRRRQASFRCARTESGRRDPWSRVVG